jgi:hypothetical protein
MLDTVKEAGNWRRLAARAKRLASSSRNAETERGLMHVAATYEDFATRLEAQSRQPDSKMASTQSP